MTFPGLRLWDDVVPAFLVYLQLMHLQIWWVQVEHLPSGSKYVVIGLVW